MNTIGITNIFLYFIFTLGNHHILGGMATFQEHLRRLQSVMAAIMKLASHNPVTQISAASGRDGPICLAPPHAEVPLEPPKGIVNIHFKSMTSII